MLCFGGGSELWSASGIHLDSRVSKMKIQTAKYPEGTFRRWPNWMSTGVRDFPDPYGQLRKR